MPTSDALARFSAPTRDWFSGAFDAPTAAQVGAWEAVAAGHHALVVAPTGSGKTLAAFLWAIDQLVSAPAPDDPAARCRVLYVSPLKALATDVERNLRSPLVGVRQAATRSGTSLTDVTVSIRTGDTPPAQRRAFATRPSDVLITTPESLFLVLTSAARAGLSGVRTVIVDEIHALAGTKRGAHLAVSLERLDALLDGEGGPGPAQRVGLSATVRPVDTVARFLSGSRTPPDGGRSVTVVAPPATKQIEVRVAVAVPDLSDLTTAPGTDLVAGSDPGPAPVSARLLPVSLRTPENSSTPSSMLQPAAENSAVRSSSVWPHVHERVVDLVAAHRSTLVFTNSRRAAERLTSRINEIWAVRQGAAVPDPGVAQPAAEPSASGTSAGVDTRDARTVLARAHHGSMSRAERTRTESELKAGLLPAVVATSSLELGIDMGAVDLVVQVGAPPSVAGGLQRLGRAGHQVGAVSRGVVFPTFRGELVAAAVIAERMVAGQIEALHVPANPLDVLAQQIVAMVATDDWAVADLAVVLRRAAPFATLGDATLRAVLDMLSGRYPSEDFAELRPRLVWDRVHDRLTARPGALRLAATSGGTIPDRGLFGVFLAGAGSAEGVQADEERSGGRARGGKRVGELDEEMVFESRVGDTFTLGSSTWRIEEITPDRVLVTPAPGLPGRLPFWHGDRPARPAELGAAMGAWVREVVALPREQAAARVRAAGLDPWASDNLLAYLDEQRQATGEVPSDRVVVLERFRDELGDWRVVVHSPYGAKVHAPWALVVAGRLQERFGVDVAAMHSDDGIVLRLPDVSQPAVDQWADPRTPPPASSDEGPVIGLDDLLLDPDAIDDAVQAQLSSSTMFAARFREAAARALLLPRRRPDRRQPLWQQRHRAAHLLGVASAYPEFPIVLEAVRECLRDDFDTQALRCLMADVRARRVRVHEVTTARPSPFAQSLLFGYSAMFLYDLDAPLAERRAAALTLDPALLTELLGGGDGGNLADLLDPDAVEQVEAELARTVPGRQAGSVEQLADLLRRQGPLPLDDLVARVRPALADQVTTWLAALVTDRRAISLRLAGVDPDRGQQWAAVEDAGRLRDGLGVALPVGVPEVFTEPVPDPLGDLVRRHARTHGPFTVASLARRFGLGVAVVGEVAARLERTGALVRGALRPEILGGTGDELCDADVLRLLRRRSLAVLRGQVEPVNQQALGVFLPRWQGVRPVGRDVVSATGDLRGVDGVARVVEQLAGVVMPASAVETHVLPARVPDYTPTMLDELMTAGQVLWAGHGSLGAHDGMVSLHPTDVADLTLPPVGIPPDGQPDSPVHAAVLEALAGGGGWMLGPLTAKVAGSSDEPVTEQLVTTVLWDLVWAGLVTNDGWVPLRAWLAARTTAHRTPRATPRGRTLSGCLALRPAGIARPTAPSGRARLGQGRWSLLPPRVEDPTQRAHAAAAQLLDRHGVWSRATAGAEGLSGVELGNVYRVLAALEESGQVRRGYFVEHLGGSQFALPGAVDRLRVDAQTAERTDPLTTGADSTPQVVVLAAADPANPYGAALAWPARDGHRPGRKAGALVVLADGALAAYVERGARSLLTWSTDPLVLASAAQGLAAVVPRTGRLTIARIDSADIPGPGLDTPAATALRDAGFRLTPRGLRLAP
ncbi:MAG: DEAD/DEAH box helicase [Micrococcales bacterium]|nr:DEAD/DEAH box helicase [Micrococcales bacterium]